MTLRRCPHRVVADAGPGDGRTLCAAADLARRSWVIPLFPAGSPYGERERRGEAETYHFWERPDLGTS